MSTQVPMVVTASGLPCSK
ncbi:hypothetical protein Tco_1487448, partial [Tanacetum coccineum]